MLEENHSSQAYIRTSQTYERYYPRIRAAPLNVCSRMGYMPQQASLDPLFPVSVLEAVLMGRLGNAKGFEFYCRADKEAAAVLFAARAPYGDPCEHRLRHDWELRGHATNYLYCRGDRPQCSGRYGRGLPCGDRGTAISQSTTAIALELQLERRRADFSCKSFLSLSPNPKGYEENTSESLSSNR